MPKQAVSCLIFNKEKNKILLIKRRDIPVWVLPGGGIEIGETPETAAVREALEETGFQVEISRKIAKYQPANRLTQTTHFFECDVIRGNAQVGKETLELDFFSLDKFPKHLVPFYRDWIADALKQLPQLIEKKIIGTSYWIFLKLLILHPILVSRFLLTKIGIHINQDGSSF